MKTRFGRRMILLMTVIALLVGSSSLMATPAIGYLQELYSLPARPKNSDNVLYEVGVWLLSLDVDPNTSGDQQVVYASPGETISVTAQYQVWTPPEIGTPYVIWQLFFIYSWTPDWPPPSGYYAPLYDGIPGRYPGVTETKTFQVTVPSTPGTYYLWFCMSQHYSMEQAIAEFTTPLTLPAHAKIVCVPPTQSRGLWVWTSAGDVVTDSTDRSAFFEFVQSKAITAIYLYCESLLRDNQPALTDFIAEAIGEHQLEVHLLMGEHSWVVDPGYGDLPDLVQLATTFTLGLPPDRRPVALHLDVEPHRLNEWDSDQASTIARYLAMLEDVQDRLAASGSPLALVVDIPFWYDDDDLIFNYQGATKRLSEHVQDIADGIVLMDYRDFAVGPDGIIAHAHNEIDYGGNIGKGVVIGVETSCGLEPEKITFCEEGEEAMERELNLTVDHYATAPGFQGIAIHDYSGYRALAVCYDFDGDGQVDIDDVMQVASRWRTFCSNPDPDNDPDTPNYDPVYDIDKDCDIDIVDIMKVVVWWGETC